MHLLHSFRHPIRSTGPALLLLLAASAGASPQEPETPQPKPWIGREAPALGAATWINLAEGEEAPTLESLRGSVVLLEFWSTVGKACGKGLPHAQMYENRYARHGLEVIALSYDPVQRVGAELEAYGVSVRVASDPSMADFHKYGVPSVPYACLIGRDGKVLYWGPPGQADDEMLAALGLEADPGRVLDELGAQVASGDSRAKLEWLIKCAPRDFDLTAFAAARAPATAGAGEESSTNADWLDAWLAAREGGESGEAQLGVLAGSEAAHFDLKRWTWRVFARKFPIDEPELLTLLDEQRYDAALDALLFREPSNELLTLVATKHLFVAYCSKVTRESRALAKKALLAEFWYLADIEPRSRTAYWSEIGIGGPTAAERADGEHFLNIGLEKVTRVSAASYFHELILRHLLTVSLASGRAPDTSRLEARARAERERLLRTAHSRHDA